MARLCDCGDVVEGRDRRDWGPPCRQKGGVDGGG